jgi:hypothetical protein
MEWVVEECEFDMVCPRQGRDGMSHRGRGISSHSISVDHTLEFFDGFAIVFHDRRHDV